MTATAKMDGQTMTWDGHEWKVDTKVDGLALHQSWKVPWREVYCTTRRGWLKETAWCLVVINLVSATATGRRWLRLREGRA